METVAITCVMKVKATARHYLECRRTVHTAVYTVSWPSPRSMPSADTFASISLFLGRKRTSKEKRKFPLRRRNSRRKKYSRQRMTNCRLEKSR